MANQEVLVGDRSLVTWDGQVIEVFGAYAASGGRRIHSAVAELEIREPDKKGRAQFSVKNARDQQNTIVQLSGDDLARLRPILDELAAAIATGR